jgi:[acyl-carrier-protein] S-malonyltransferase
MGLDLYQNYPEAKRTFEKQIPFVGFPITDVDVQRNAEDLKQTRVTQPAIFLYW